MQRRHFLQLGGGLALALLTVGCGDSREEIVVTPTSPNNGGIATARLSEDELFETDGSGRVLAIDSVEGTVKGYSTTGALVYTSREANNPVSGALGPDGTAYILDLGTAEIVVLSPDGTLLRRMAGDGVLTFARDLAFGNNELYVLDHASGTINVLSLTGEVLRSLSVGQSGSGSHLRAVVVDADGNLRLLASNPVEVRVLDAQTAAQIQSFGTEQALSAIDLAVTEDGGTIVVDHIGNQLLVFAPDGGFVGSQSALDSDGDAAQPLRLALGSDGRLYLSINEVS